MAIDTMLNPIGMAKKLSVAQLQQAIQDGTIPSYVGIPVLQEKIALEQRLRNDMAKPPQGPSVAQQVMQEAQGLNQLQSGLPVQMAGGGIVAFAEGDLVDDDEETEDEFDKSMRQAVSKMEQYRQYMEALRDRDSKNVETFPRFETEEVTKGMSVKEGDQPARSVEKTEKRVSKPGGLDDLLAMIEQKESGKRRYDKYGNVLTSPKGAMGEMQVMPATSRDPGFGIRPAREGDLDDLARVGREYYGAMLNRYGDPKIAAIAYNMGPGATDKWLMSGGDMSRLPAETRQYSQGFAEGGIARFQVGGDIFGMSPSEAMDYARRNLRFDQLRQAFGGAPATPAAAPVAAAPAAAESGGIMDFLKSGFSRLNPAGLAGWGFGAYHPSLNVGEEQELARRRAMPPTITRKPPAFADSDAAERADRMTGDIAPAYSDSDAAELADRMTGGGADETAKSAEPEETKEDEFAGLRERLLKGYDKLEKQQESDKYLALLSAGLGMMGGTSPFAAANIGAGGLKGVQAMQQAEASRAAQERGLMGLELGVGRYGQYGKLQEAQQEMNKLWKQEQIEAKKAALTESQRSHLAAERDRAERNLSSVVKFVSANLIKDIGLSESEREQKVWSHPLVIKAARDAGMDVSSLGGMSPDRASKFSVERR